MAGEGNPWRTSLDSLRNVPDCPGVGSVSRQPAEEPAPGNGAKPRPARPTPQSGPPARYSGNGKTVPGSPVEPQSAGGAAAAARNSSATAGILVPIRASRT